MAITGISKSGFIPFTHPSLEGTSVQRMSHVIGNAFATSRAIDLFNKKPDILVSHSIFNLGFYTAEGYPKTVELISNEGSLIVERRPSQMYAVDLVVEDGEFYFRTKNETDGLLQEKVAVKCHQFPNSERALRIYEADFFGNLELDAGVIGERENEENKPVFVSSFSLRSFEQCCRMAKVFELEKLDGVDLGGGIGSFGFQAANFFRNFTMIEIFNPLHEKCAQLYAKLKSDGLVSNNVNIVNGNFLSPDFDITPYSFVYLFKPIYENEDKIIDLLLKTSPGTLILSDLFSGLYHHPGFKMVPMAPSLNTRSYSHIFRRQP